jgi:tetratricopeptide (TPR) repeat protein
MKKKTIYLSFIILFIAAIVGIAYRYNQSKKEKENTVYELLDRKGEAGTTKEFNEVKNKAAALLTAIQTNQTDTKSTLKLAALFIQEARETGNHSYYDKAAMHYANKVLAQDSLDFNALVFKSLIYLSQHHFADGLAIAHKAQQVNPNNAYVYGLLVDGNVEMGNYDSAVVNADRMNAIRPDLTSYSRVSYLREIFGDYNNSIKAMKMAVETGGAGDEHTEWTRTQLAQLYEKIGDFKTADTLYKLSLSMRPNYAYATAGLARIALATKDYKTAITYFEKADAIVNDNGIKAELVDVYRAAGETKKADETAKKVIDELAKDAQANDKDETLGHYGDRELAYAYLKVNNTDKALEHALLEYNRRPNNIDVNETVAWVYYCKGDYAKALPYIKVALKTNSKNPVLLSRAGLIYLKAGQKEMAKPMLQQAAANTAFIGISLSEETMNALKNI